MHHKKVKEGATTMMEEIDKGMDQLKEQYIEPYVNQRRPSKGEQCVVDVNISPYSE